MFNNKVITVLMRASESVLKRVTPEFIIVINSYAILSLLFFWEIVFRYRWFSEDFFAFNFPIRFYAAVEINKFSFPLWNPFIFSGTPFFADIQTAVLYPFNLFLSIFVKDNFLSYFIVEFQVVLHFALGGFFMYLFIRSLNLDPFSSFLGGVLFVFSGFFISHAHHSNIIYSGVWLPIVFFCCNQWFKYKRRYWLWLCSSFLTVSLFGGHPQITLYILYSFSCYYFFLSFSVGKDESFFKHLFNYLVVILFFLLFSMVQILPSAEFLQNTNRSVLGFSDAVKDSLPIRSLITLFMPDFFDSIYESWQRWEFRYYMGLSAIVLAMFGMLRANATVKFFLVLALFSLTLALGENTFVYKIFYTLAPGFQHVRVPARFIYIFTFAIAVIAAHGCFFFSESAWLKSKFNKSLELKKIIFVGFLFLIAIPIVFCFVLPSPIKNHINHFISYLIITQGTILSLYFHIKYKKKAPWMKAVILFLITVDLLSHRATFNQTPINMETKITHSRVARALKQETEGTRFYDMGHKYPMYANMGLIYRMSNIAGYNPFYLKNYSKLNLTSPKTASILGAKLIDFQSQKGIKKTWKDKSSFHIKNNFLLNDERLPIAFFVNKAIVYPQFNLQDELNNSDFDPLEVVYLREELNEPYSTKPNSSPEYTVSRFENKGSKIVLDLRNNTEGFLVLSEIYYPGWRVFVNGEEEEVLVADSLFKAVRILDQSNKIEFIFRPRTFIIGCYVSLISLSVMIVSIFHEIKNRYRFTAVQLNT